MIITIVTSKSLHRDEVVKNRIYPFIKNLRKNSHQLNLITGDQDKIKHDISLDQYLNFPTPNCAGKNFFLRFFLEALHGYKVLKVLKKSNSDVVILTIPSMLLFFLFKPKKGVLNVLDVRDLTWEYLSFFKLMSKYTPLIKILAKKFSKYQLISMTNSHELSRISMAYKQPLSKLILIPNGISRKQYLKLSKVKESNQNRLQILYVGNIGFAQDMTTLIEAAKNVPDVDFTIVGDGNDFMRIEELIRVYGVKNVNLAGRVSWHEVFNYYNNADLLYAQLSHNYAGALPSKLYEYLSTGKNVLYGGDGVAPEFLSKFENTTVIRSQDKDELITAIKYFQRKKAKNQLFNLSRKNKNKIAKNFIREKGLLEFNARINSEKKLSSAHLRGDVAAE